MQSFSVQQPAQGQQEPAQQQPAPAQRHPPQAQQQQPQAQQPALTSKQVQSIFANALGLHRVCTYPGVDAVTVESGGETTVTWMAWVPCWCAVGGTIHLGYFGTPEDAAKARDTFVVLNTWRDRNGRLLQLSFPIISGEAAVRSPEYA